jgi:hypothetical protein
VSQPTRAEFQRLLASGELFERYAQMVKELEARVVDTQYAAPLATASTNEAIRAWLEERRFVPSRRFDGDEAMERAYAHTSGYGYVTLLFDQGARGWEASVWQGDINDRAGIGLGYCTRVGQMEAIYQALVALDYDRRSAPLEG